MLHAPDPYDPDLPSAFDHDAFYVEGEPYQGDVPDTGLRCHCGREVVATLNDPDGSAYGWAHVGIGDASDRTGDEIDQPRTTLRAVG